MKLSNEIEKLAIEAMSLCREAFRAVEKIAEENQKKMLMAFINNKVSESHINLSTTGYGYSDPGRETLEKVYATYFGAESALVRHSFFSGTHALTVMLFGILRPGDTFLSVTGRVYDTLESVIGLNNNTSAYGTLKDFSINYDQLDLTPDGSIDVSGIESKVNEKTRIIYIQRSSGYGLRRAITCEEICDVVETVKKRRIDCAVVVDNCYGEFTQNIEPTSVGADLCVGSLIKNPGGGIASGGGYIVGREDLVNMCAQRLTSPGMGKEVGATFGSNRELFLGFFNAPLIVEQSLKSAIFASALFSLMGYEVFPKYNQVRSDIVTAIILRSKEKLIKFCQTIQKYSPIDSFSLPLPWGMPGYDDKVIMASGSFTSGSSIELSADAPLREPWTAYLQGGLNFGSTKFAICKAAEAISSGCY